MSHKRPPAATGPTTQSKRSRNDSDGDPQEGSSQNKQLGEVFEERLRNPDYFHWLKSQFALMKVKEVILGPVESTSETMHKEMCDNIEKRIGRSIAPCSNQRNCVEKGRKLQGCCSTCSEWICEIDKKKKKKFTNLSNGDFRLWSTNHWEVAKTFMGPYQHSSADAKSCDPTGVLQFMVNCKSFGYSQDDCGQIDEVIQMRNRNMHHHSQQIDAVQFEKDIDACLEVIRIPDLIAQGADRLLVTQAVNELQRVKKLTYEDVLKSEEWDSLETKFVREELQTLQTFVKDGMESVQKSIDMWNKFILQHKDLRDRLEYVAETVTETHSDVKYVAKTVTETHSDVKDVVKGMSALTQTKSCVENMAQDVNDTKGITSQTHEMVKHLYEKVVRKGQLRIKREKREDSSGTEGKSEGTELGQEGKASGQFWDWREKRGFSSVVKKYQTDYSKKWVVMTFYPSLAT